MRKTEALNKPSEADCIHFTDSWYCMDLIPQSEDGGAKSLSSLIEKCAFSMIH
jgi:hypothetical protein